MTQRPGSRLVPTPNPLRKRETTREVMVRAAHTPAGARLWWAASIVVGATPLLLKTADDVAKFERWSQVFAPSFLVPFLLLLMVSAAGVVMGIAGPAPRDVARRSLRSLR